MKPILRTPRNADWQEIPKTESPGETRPIEKRRHPLPPGMENRPDAAELRAFILHFQRIKSPEGRRAVMNAVTAATGGDE